MTAWKKIQTACLLLPALALVLTGCATPVGVRELIPRQSYRNAQANPLNDGVLSDETNVVLNRFDLLQTFKKSPAAAIASLHQKALGDNRRDILCALAEVSYIYGEQVQQSLGPSNRKFSADYFLLAAVYAYFYITGGLEEPPHDAIDRRLHAAYDLYNYSLWRALAAGDDGSLAIEQGMRALPVGGLVITLNTSQFPWNLDDFTAFMPAYKYGVRGFAVLNRNPGLGLPLIGLKKHVPGSIINHLTVPATAFLRIQGDLQEFTRGAAPAGIELYSTYDDAEVSIGNRSAALEIDTTTPIAYMLEHETNLWDMGLRAFQGKLMENPNKLYLIQPYQPGRVPVVFVHGTLSSPVSWAEMWNTLRSDPVLRRTTQFWFFIYNSSLPSTISAADLRDSLQNLVAAIDPEGKDPALRQMVVIGHSQGGILAKLTAVETGDRLVKSLIDKDLDSLNVSEDIKQMARRALIVKPLPFVKQVVFIATPHRGSFRLNSWTREMLRLGINLPANIIKTPFSVYAFLRDDVSTVFRDKVPTSFDSMSPDNPVLKALVDIPLAPGVQGHSIIAVKGNGELAAANDGFVEYSSAHLESMQSELVVRTSHLCEDHPFVIEEVRRILLENLQQKD